MNDTSLCRRAHRSRVLGFFGAATLLFSLSACAAVSGTGTPDTPDEPGGVATTDALQLETGALNFDPAKYCGNKPMRIGNITGFGGNTWMQSVRAIIDKFQDTCPNIEEIQYYDANGDVTKYNSTINAWAAQGFDVIYAFDGTFGQQTLPAFRAAQQAGVKVGVSNVILGDDVVPSTVTASVVQDVGDMAAHWVEFFDEAMSSGTSKILVIGGTAGNQIDADIIQSMKDRIQETSADVEFLDNQSIVGNWDIATSAQAAASVIPKYTEIDGVLLTNAAVAPSVIRAFQNANRPVPAIAGTGVTSGAICEVDKLRSEQPDIQMLTLDGTGNVGPIALAKAIASFQGIGAPELGPDDAETYVKLARYVDTINGNMPACDPALPADADPTMALTADEIRATVG